MYQFPIGMEMFSAADEDQWEIIKETIDSSDYYVLIIGHRYGSVIKDGDYAGISYTQKEFYYALEKEIPVLAFLIDRKAAVMPGNMEQDTDKKEKSKICIEECMLKEGISEDVFCSKYYDEYEYEWFYIGRAIEIFYTKLGIDYSIIA